MLVPIVSWTSNPPYGIFVWGCDFSERLNHRNGPKLSKNNQNGQLLHVSVNPKINAQKTYGESDFLCFCKLKYS